jgi:uncharacterized Fe-S center protein
VIDVASKVYFTDFRAKKNISLVNKMAKLYTRAGLDKIIEPKDLVAIKIHFGERGNMAYIRPPYVRRVVDLVKEKGGRPFITDANTLYVGTRANSVDHLETAILNGFDYAVAGAPLIIADGLTGGDYVKVKINGKHFEKVNIASAAYHADAMVVMSHFKCHELAGFGGAVKNLGMGLGSRSGKQQMHSNVRPGVKGENCIGCEKCIPWCPAEAIKMQEWSGNKKGQRSHILEEKCWGCGECIIACQFGAITPSWGTSIEALQEKMAEYAVGAVAGKEGKVAYLSFLTDISPECDCYGYNDFPIVQNIGMMASFDPVALDKACADMVNKAPALAGSVVEGLPAGEDKFEKVHPGIGWLAQLQHAEKMGLGTMEYEIIEV